MRLLFIFLLLVAQDASAWRQKTVSKGVTWKTRHVGKQRVNVLEVDKGATIRFVHAGGLKRTSAMAEASNAVAAVNGGFYTGKGEPYALLKIDGKLIKPGDDRWPAIGIDSKDRPHFKPKAPGNWDEVAHALACGPTLAVNGKVQIGDLYNHSNDRHPRTAIGIARSGRIVLVTVDGRSSDAAGMSFDELAKLMLELGCESAINLDGGGSTTMWLKGDGIVNRPSDKAGERPVGNAVLVMAQK